MSMSSVCVCVGMSVCVMCASQSEPRCVFCLFFSVTLQAVVKSTVRIRTATVVERRRKRRRGAERGLIPPPTSPSTLFPPPTASVQSSNQTHQNLPSNQKQALPYTGFISWRKTFAVNHRQGAKAEQERPRKRKSAPCWPLSRITPLSTDPALSLVTLGDHMFLFPGHVLDLTFVSWEKIQ